MTDSEEAQKLGFDTYILIRSKDSKSAPSLCRVDDKFPDNGIKIGCRDSSPSPLSWTSSSLSAVQVVEGKMKRDVLRSQKVVLCQVEDHRHRWFEVAVLDDRLNYPFGNHLVGLRSFPCKSLKEAKRKFASLKRKANRG
jgi:hypothetical protein